MILEGKKREDGFFETAKKTAFDCLGVVLEIFDWKKFRFNTLRIEISNKGKITETHKYLVIRYK